MLVWLDGSGPVVFFADTFLCLKLAFSTPFPSTVKGAVLVKCW